MQAVSRRTLLLGGAASVAGVVPRGDRPTQDGLLTRDHDVIAAKARAFMEKYGAPGLQVAIAQDDRLVYAQGFGMADRDAGEPVTPQSLFRIASVAKPFTSATLFRLIEAGRVRLQDRVVGPQGILGTDYGSPPYRQWVEDVTVEHLLTHTCGGWPNDGTDPMFHHPRMDHQELIATTLRDLPLTHEPGTHYAYSNFGYCVLGRVIEKLTRQSYETAVGVQVLRPCGIRRMRIAGNTLAERTAGEVVYYGQGGEDPYGMNVRRMDAHGGWLASATDLVRFLVRVDGFPQRPDILSEAAVRSITTGSRANAHYAKGWAVNSSQNWWHNGSLPGTTSILVRAASGFCWAGLTNTRRPGSDIDTGLDRLMWDMVGGVTAWPQMDLFDGRA